MRSFTHLIALSLALATQGLSQSFPTSTATAISSSNSIITTPLTNPLLSTSDRPTPVSECPIIISTSSVCSTCMTIDCVTVSTVTAGCTCANPPVTIYQTWGCEKGCDALPSGCKTLYEVVSEAGRCSETSGGDFGNGTAATGSMVMSFSSGHPLGPIQPTISGPISMNAAGRQARPFRFW